MATAANNERLVLVTDEHWIKYVRPIAVAVLLIAISIALFVAAGVTAYSAPVVAEVLFIAALILLLFTHHWLFMVLLSEDLDRIVITNHRLIRFHYYLIFSEDSLEVSFDKMKTVDARKQGILQNLFHYGTLYFETKLASIPLVPHPNTVSRIIQETMHTKS